MHGERHRRSTTTTVPIHRPPRARVIRALPFMSVSWADGAVRLWSMVGECRGLGNHILAADVPDMAGAGDGRAYAPDANAVAPRDLGDLRDLPGQLQGENRTTDRHSPPVNQFA